MSDLTNNPLQALIDQAAELPKSNTLKPYAQRINPSPRRKLSGRIALLDISGSMGESVRGKRKIDILRQALDRPVAADESIFAFSTTCKEIPDFWSIPDPEASTALHTAIDVIVPRKPMLTLVVSDGKPDDAKQALSAARKLSGVINTLYIGPDSDKDAIAFMRQLARLGCGQAGVCDLTKNNVGVPELQAAIRLYLPAAK